MGNLTSNKFKEKKSSLAVQKYAGQVQIKSIAIVPASGDIVSLTKPPIIATNIKIYESLFKHTLTGEMTLNDGSAIPEITPIIGAEKIVIAWTIPESKIEVKGIFRIIGIRDRQPFEGNQVGQTYTIDFVSDERIMDAYTTVSKRYTGPVNQIIKSIYDEYLDTGKGAFFEDTLATIAYISPKLHPFDIIARLSNYAMSSTNQSGAYHFFENLDGFHYRSLNTLLSNAPINKKPYVWDLKHFKTATKSKTEDEMMKMNSYMIENSFANPLTGLRNGKFASSSYSHDIYNKKINRGSNEAPLVYDYLDQFKNVAHSEIFPVIPKMSIIGGKNSEKVAYMSSASDSYFEVVNLNSSLYKNQEENKTTKSFDHPNNTQNLLGLFRNSQRQEVENFRMAVNAPGHPSLSVGHTLNVLLRSEIISKKNPDKFIKNEVLSGKYLIAETMHDINPTTDEYSTKMTLVKDSTSISFEGTTLGSEELMGDP